MTYTRNSECGQIKSLPTALVVEAAVMLKESKKNTGVHVQSADNSSGIVKYDIVEYDNDQKTDTKKGILFLIAAIIIYVVGVQMSNTVLKGDEFRKPFLLSFVTGSCFSILLIPELFRFIYLKSKLLNTNEDAVVLIGVEPDISQGEEMPTHVEDFEVPQLSNMELAQLAMTIAIIYNSYFLANMSALQFASASNLVVLGTTTSIFTLVIGSWMRIDKLTLKKVMCVAGCIIGIILINVGEKSEVTTEDYTTQEGALGNFVAIFGALLYSFFLIILKFKKQKKTTNERALFGYVGILSIFLAIPGVLIANLTGMEQFEIPSLRQGIFIIISGIVNATSDYLSVVALVLISPLITSLALSSVVPMTIIFDILFCKWNGTSIVKDNVWVYGFGIISVLLSVTILSVSPQESQVEYSKIEVITDVGSEESDTFLTKGQREGKHLLNKYDSISEVI